MEKLCKNYSRDKSMISKLLNCVIKNTQRRRIRIELMKDQLVYWKIKLINKKTLWFSNKTIKVSKYSKKDRDKN